MKFNFLVCYYDTMENNFLILSFLFNMPVVTAFYMTFEKNSNIIIYTATRSISGIFLWIV